MPTSGLYNRALSTQEKLDALNRRISDDWSSMGFAPLQQPADPRTQYVPNNGPDLNLTAGANSYFADPEYMRPPPYMAPRNPAGGMSFTPSLPAEAKGPVPPKPTPRPARTTYTVQEGDNPTTIARKLGMSLKQLAKKNPGLLKKARRLQVGTTLKV